MLLLLSDTCNVRCTFFSIFLFINSILLKDILFSMVVISMTGKLRELANVLLKISHNLLMM